MAKEQHILSGEQILDNNLGPHFLGPLTKETVLEAMDEWAKIQSIAFRNWEPPVGSYNSDEDLYEIFEQKKSK